MGFDTLLGNEHIKQTLSLSLKKGRISHFYLISGPEGSGKHTLAKALAAAILCTGDDAPCGVCAACRKVKEGLHPDFITVDDPEKKTVPVDLIRQARADMYIRPNESEHKIYLFPRAQDMGIPGQNALLKVLEEPPAYGVFLLLTDNPEKLLPTVRSRCVELKMQALPEKELLQALRREFPDSPPENLEAAAARSGGFLGQARALLEGGGLPLQTEMLVKALCTRDSLLLVQLFAPMEKWKRDELAAILQSWLELTESALVCACGGSAVAPQARALAAACDARQLHAVVEYLKKALEYTRGNVSPAAVCGYLSWALR